MKPKIKVGDSCEVYGRPAVVIEVDGDKIHVRMTDTKHMAWVSLDACRRTAGEARLAAPSPPPAQKETLF